MRKERSHCQCDKQIPFQCKDEFNSIACETCYEIISYEIPEKKKFFKINHLQPTILDFVDVLNKIKPDIC